MASFAACCSLVERYIEGRGIRVVVRDVPDPLLGDLDGAEIHIDHLLDDEQRLFLLVHLFGHTVQWNVHPEAFELGRLQTPPVDERLLPAIAAYEREAAAYGLAMLHQVGAAGLDQWLAAYTARDIAYLLHYYRTGEKRPFDEFPCADAPAIEPRPVPVFTPVRRSHGAGGGIVV